ncbi:MAG: trypsin-like serine protease [Candidatus Aegiribacteria sp.]|nr:trypsin-like serine protease [Candidatus Aegiribacteria sp.]MBD3295524.1 trypsin-like serine protease [Candidatus Fermentibacteria bacterium]
MKILTAVAILLTALPVLADEVDQAMVKIYTNSSAYNYYIPWSPDAPREKYGSGCVINNDLILTNAHVVSDQTFLQVRKEGDPRKYSASVVAVSHDADLALITVAEPSFFHGIQPLELGDLPQTRQQVTVYGYPVGGDALSTTQGVISRIETSRYVHSSLSLLTVQLDAAINPGNSGGPAIVDDRIVGVAMQSRDQAENIGYVIPVPVIEHFLQDLDDGELDGFPAAGFSYQTVRNPAASRVLGIEQEQTGVIVTGMASDSPASAVLQQGDVVMSIDGREIAGDGTVELRSGSRTALSYMISRRQLGDTITMEIIRNGEPSSVDMLLDATVHDLSIVSTKIFDIPPEYMIFGGVLFMPLTINYLETWGSEWYLNAPDYLTYHYLYSNWRTEETEEIVVLAYLLPSDVNTGYEDLRNEAVVEVNGNPVVSFSEFVSLVDESTGDFVEVRTNLGKVMILNRSSALEANRSIMTRYGVQNDRVVY